MSFIFLLAAAHPSISARGTGKAGENGQSSRRCATPAWSRPSVLRSRSGDYGRAAWAGSLQTGSPAGSASGWSCSALGSMYSRAATRACSRMLIACLRVDRVADCRDRGD